MSECRPWNMLLIVLVALCAAGQARWAPAGESFMLAEDDGYRGIWYSNQKTNDEYVFKYSGGMATYPQQHVPIAHYASAVDKTFFVYGGVTRNGKSLLHMVSYFDHRTGTFPRPRILLDKKTDDAHDNPTLTIDAAGHLWIFSNSHGRSRPSYVHRSTKPYAIDAFEPVLTTNFSYSQPWTLADGSFLLMHTRYKQGRGLFWMTSRDGRAWGEPRSLAHMAQGHYQVTGSDGKRVASVFNYHPDKGGLNARTNLYYVETADAGQTWRTADGTKLDVPLTEVHNPALVHDYQSEQLLVYLKEVQFDREGRPIVLYLNSRGFEPGPKHGPHTWRLARWTGQAWEINDVVTSDHNYDFGALYLEQDDDWRLIAPTGAGAQPYCTGGQMVLWASSDQGRTWRKVKELTHDERHNHTYARRPLNARPEFYALWADGHAHKPSDSALYFTDREGTHVWRLPRTMSGATQAAEVAW